MREGFVAGCRACGAPHALPLLDASAPCAHCNTADPLEPASRARVEQAAAKVCRLAVRAQQQEHAREGHSFELGLMAAAFAIPSWLLFGGLALSMVYAEKPESLSLWQLLHVQQTGGGNTPETGTVLAFWLLFLLVAGVELSLLTVFASLFVARKALPPPRALPPLDEQSPPRCHLCGAGLGVGGVHRRCTHCGTSNLVDGRAFDAQVTAMHEQLDRVERALVARGVAAGRAVDKVIMTSALYPIGLLLALPLGMIGEPRTAPELVPGLYALGGLVALGVLAWLSRWGSRVRRLSELAIGAPVRVRGRAYTLAGRIEATSGTVAGASSLVVVHAVHDRSLDLALELAGDGEKLRCFELRPGGAPLEPSHAGQLAQLTLTTVRGPAPGAATAEDTPRLFEGAPAPGAAPGWTLHRVSVPRDDVLVL